MKIKSDSNRAKLQSKHFGCNHRRLPSGLPSKLGAGRANTRDYIANRCVLLKYASASRVAEGARGLAHGAFCTRGTVNELEALPAELGFADTLISVEFPALKRNQARSLEGSVGAGKRGGRGGSLCPSSSAGEPGKGCRNQNSGVVWLHSLAWGKG